MQQHFNLSLKKLFGLIVFILFFSLLKGHAQKASVEQNVWGVQTLVHPLSVYNETKLTDNIALRSEVGFSFAGGNFQSTSYTEDQWSGGSLDWAAWPVFIVEPRCYYNLNRRASKEKRIDGNSGNYLSLNIGVEPGVGFKSDHVDLYPGVYVIPMYGLRRNIGRHFNFEAAFGIGYGWTFKEYQILHSDFTTTTHNHTSKGTLIGMRLAFGYWF